MAPEIEIGAEVFAAEFIFPEEEFSTWASRFVALGQCKPEHVVALKRDCPARVSYAYLVKRLEWLHFAEKGALGGVNYTKLEVRLYGPPLYKKILLWRRRRAARQSS